MGAGAAQRRDGRDNCILLCCLVEVLRDLAFSNRKFEPHCTNARENETNSGNVLKIQ